MQTERNAPAKNLLAKIASGEVAPNREGVREFYADAESLSLFRLRADAVDENESLPESPAKLDSSTDQSSPRERERQFAEIVNNFATFEQLTIAFGLWTVERLCPESVNR